MSEPIKPRIDFDEPLQPPQEPALRAGVAFDAEQAESFSAAPELQQEEEEGRAEGIINAALKPKRSLWRKMVTAGRRCSASAWWRRACSGCIPPGCSRTGSPWAAAWPAA